MSQYKVHTCLVKNVPPDIYKQLYRLNYGDNGPMREWISTARYKVNKDNTSRVYYIEAYGKVLAWAMGGHCAYWKNTNIAMFWTRRAHRRQGLAHLLFAEIYKTTKSFTVDTGYNNKVFFHKMRKLYPRKG
jgi:GNAT superfamily N-acetyltransferase